MEGNTARGVQFVADRILNPPAAAGRGGRGGPLTAGAAGLVERGGVIYAELCFSCHGEDGRGTPTPGAAAGSTLAPSLAGSARVNGHRDYVIKTMLHGLTGPIEGRSYPQVMVAMGTNTDQWIAEISSYVRNSFGNAGTVVDAGRGRARARRHRRPQDAVDGRRSSNASLPRALVPDATWKITASHDARPAPQANAEGGYNFVGNAAGALNFLGWTTGVPQQPGMWLQVELPAPVMLVGDPVHLVDHGRARRRAGVIDVPARYQVQVSADGKTWSAPVAEGEGTPGRHRRSRSRRSAPGSCGSRKPRAWPTRRRGR